MIYLNIIKIIYSFIATILISLFCISFVISDIKDILYFIRDHKEYTFRTSTYYMFIYYLINIFINIFMIIFLWIFLYFNFLSQNNKIHLTYAILTTFICSLICIFLFNHSRFYNDLFSSNKYNETTIGTITKLICYDNSDETCDSNSSNNSDNSIIEYTVNNVKYAGETGLDNLKVGQKITINYNSDNPDTFKFKYAKYKIISWIVLILSIIIFIFLWIFLYKYIQLI